MVISIARGYVLDIVSSFICNRLIGNRWLPSTRTLLDYIVSTLRPSFPPFSETACSPRILRLDSSPVDQTSTAVLRV